MYAIAPGHFFMASIGDSPEIEIVPEEIIEILYKKTDIFLIGMGSGTICDAQYLFSEDILGYNNDHTPRHAKTYGNLKKNYDEIKTKLENIRDEFNAGS